MAVPFDVEKLELTGDPAAVTSGVMQADHQTLWPLDSGAGQFSISQSGVFAYVPGGLFQFPDRSVLWVDRSGAERPLAGCPPRTYSSVTLSPDGQRFAFGTLPFGDRNIWVSDVTNCGVTRLTDGGYNEGPLWTPDGKRIVFTTIQGSRSELRLKPVEGGSTERLVARSNAAYAQSWTPDGSALAFTDFRQQANNDIWIVPLSNDRQPVPILTSRFSENHAEFSPNGRWLAYVSNDTGRFEVFVRPYPGAGVGQPISTGGGNSPAWSRDGKELFYTTLPGPGGIIKMMAVPVTTTASTFAHGTPRMLFEGRYHTNVIGRQYDVTRDGSRFLMVRVIDRPPVKPTHMVLVQNWFEELNRAVPAR